MFSGYAIGGMTSALLGAWLVPQFGWKIMFLLAGTPLLFLPILWKYLPESLMYLTNKQQTAQAQSIIRKISPTQIIGSDTQFVLNEVQKAMKHL